MSRNLLFAGPMIEMLEGRKLLSGVISIGATVDTAYRQTSDDGVIVLTRRGDISADVTVPLTIGGSATNGVDYGRFGDSVTIPAGTQSVLLKVRPVYSGQAGASEYMSVLIGDVAGYRMGQNVASVDIVDNIASPNAVRNQGITVTSMRTTNDIRRGTAGRFILTRTSDLGETTTIPIDVTGTAVNGGDFGFIADRVTFLPGVGELVINVRSGTPRFPGDRTVTLTAGELRGAVPNSSSLVISGASISPSATLPGAAVGNSRVSGTPTGVSAGTSSSASQTPATTTGSSSIGSTPGATDTSSRFSELPGAIATGSTNGQTQFGTTGIGTSLGVGTAS